MSEPYVTVASGRDLFGRRWEVGVRGPGVVVNVSGGTLHLDDDDPDDGPLLAPFAEAVARAQQLAGAHGTAPASGMNTVERLARDLIGIPDNL